MANEKENKAATTTEVATKEKVVYTLAEIPGSLKSVTKSQAFTSAIEGFFEKETNRNRFIQSAVNALTKTPKLNNCDKMSFFGSLMQLAAFGLMPNGRDAHLIPYGTTCTLVIDYKGLVNMALRNPKVLDVHAVEVYETDTFYKENDRFYHRVDNPLAPIEKRGKVIGFYAYAHLQGGGFVDEAMNIEQVNEIRSRSRAKDNGPWVTDYNEMAKKTVFKRLTKWLPVTAELAEAIDKDNEEYDNGKSQTFERKGRVTASSLLGGESEQQGETIDV